MLPTALTGILDLDIATAPALSVTVFLRMKMGAKLDQACKLKAELELHERKGEKLTLEEVTEKVRDENGRLVRSYVTNMFKVNTKSF